MVTPLLEKNTGLMVLSFFFQSGLQITASVITMSLPLGILHCHPVTHSSYRGVIPPTDASAKGEVLFPTVPVPFIDTNARRGDSSFCRH